MSARQIRTTPKATATVIPGCIPRECVEFAGIGPCPHGVQWAAQRPGATWQGRHRLVDDGGQMGAWLEGAYAGTATDLKRALEGRILAFMQREYPAWANEEFGLAVVKGIAKTLRSNLLTRENWANQYACEMACDRAGVKKHYGPYLFAYLTRAQARTEAA